MAQAQQLCTVEVMIGNEQRRRDAADAAAEGERVDPVAEEVVRYEGDGVG